MEKIPKELRERPQWVCWRSEERSGKSTKVPYNPQTGRRASTTDPTTWSHYRTAFHQSRNGSDYKGIGFVFTPDDPFVGIDLDHCVNEDGQLESWAGNIIKQLDSYTERSPSGKGVHIFVKAQIPGDRRRKDKVEMYDSGRYFTVTGDRVGKTPDTIEDRADELKGLYEEVFGSDKPTVEDVEPGIPALNDHELIEEIKASRQRPKFEALWSGDISGYHSHSEADLALCGILSFRTQDRVQIERLFRQSDLYREKWERDGYREGVISTALEDLRNKYQPPRPRIGGAEPTEDVWTAIKNNEVGDAGLLIHAFSGRFCFDLSGGGWYEFREHSWRYDKHKNAFNMPDEAVRRYAAEHDRQSTLARKAAESGHSDKEPAKKTDQLRARMKALQAKSRRSKVLDLATYGEGSLGTSGEDWDSEPWLLACANGVIDLRTGRLRDGKPTDYIKTSSSTKWAGIDADCPRWDEFLNQVFDSDRELIDYIQRLLGSTLVGRVFNHILPIFWGTGRNGKSTLLETVKHVLGPLAGKVESEMLLDAGLAKSSSAPSPDIVALRGRRVIWASETSEGRKFDAAKVKHLVGGDTLVGRPLYSNQLIEFQPTHSLILMTNHRPKADAADYAFWARVHLIPFNRRFVTEPEADNEGSCDFNLPEKLEDEASGILAWLVRGGLEWQKNDKKLAPPNTVKVATEAYREAENDVANFINERCDSKEGKMIQQAELLDAYARWCEREGIKPMGRNKFYQRVGDLGFSRKDGAKGKKFVGLGLKRSDDE